MKRKLLLLIGGVVITLLTACSLAPKYTRPAAPVPADWPKGAAYQETVTATVAPAPSELNWQEFFPDEKLQKVITMALKNNRDLRLAVLNVERARALYGIQRAELLPAVNAVGGMSRQRVPADLSSSGKAITVEQYGVNFGISSWEIDFFGRCKSSSEDAPGEISFGGMTLPSPVGRNSPCRGDPIRRFKAFSSWAASCV
jgi:multidrug efflux system outer membrane protein